MQADNIIIEKYGYLIKILVNNKRYYIEYCGNGRNLNYSFYKAKEKTKIEDQAEIKELTEAVIKYRAGRKGNYKGVLCVSEYGSYIFSNANQNCNVFIVQVPLADGDIADFKQSFQENNTGNKNFFSIILNSGGGKNEVGHVSTLIVDCSEGQSKLYLLDTSENVHQLKDKTRVRQNIVKTNQPICCLNSVKKKSLQNDTSCTTWAAVINSKLTQKTDIGEIIDTQHGCLKIEFLEEVINGIIEINEEFINLNNYKSLIAKIQSQQRETNAQVRQTMPISREEVILQEEMLPKEKQGGGSISRRVNVDLKIRNRKANRQPQNITDTQIEEYTQQQINDTKSESFKSLQKCSSGDNDVKSPLDMPNGSCSTTVIKK